MQQPQHYKFSAMALENGTKQAGIVLVLLVP